MGPRNAIVLGSWFMNREMELATLRACLVTVRPTELPTVTMELPASKSELAALGVARTHACTCSGGAAQADCPAHAAWDKHLLLQKLFPTSFGSEGPVVSLPFFPNRFGKPVWKKGMVETILFAAQTGWPESPATLSDPPVPRDFPGWG